MDGKSTEEEHLQAECRLVNSESELRAIYDGLLDGLLIADAETKKFIKTNPAMCHMLGYETQELLSLSVENIHPPDRLEEVLERFEEAARGRRQKIENVPILRKTGEISFVDIGVGQMNYQGRLCLVGLFHDITERRRMGDILQRSHEELELRVQERTRELVEAVNKQNEYAAQLRRVADELARTERRERQRLSQVLHDGLQQHLVAALYQLELAGDGNASGKALDQLRMLLNESIKVSHELSAELCPPVLLRGDLCAALDWLLQWMRNKHGLETHLDAEEDIPLLKEETALALFEIARELLFNVVKHSGVKEAFVQLHHRDGYVSLTVTDHGKGFDAVTGRPEGLGLFYVSERISLLGGELQIESMPGNGSRISVLLPTSPETSKSTGSNDADPATGFDASRGCEAGRNIRIILADDHISVRQGMADLINREADFEIVGEASNGKEAVEMAKKMRPDVVLMDVNMPETDGIEATQIIHKENADICIIGFSMYEEASLQRALLEAGASAYFSKQGSSKDLKNAIRACYRGELAINPRPRPVDPE